MDFTLCFGVVFFLSQPIAVVDGTYSTSTESALRTQYLGSYNTKARPDATTNVSVFFSIFSLNSLNIVSQTMTIAGYINMQWYDSRLYWQNDTTYNSQLAIYVTDDEVWTPSLIVENSVSNIAVLDDDVTPLRVSQSGDISWSFPGIFKVHCDCDVTYYPFDTQTCPIALTTWGYTSREITLTFSDDPVQLTYFNENGEWTFMGDSTHEESTTRDKQSATIMSFKFEFRRRPMFQILNTIMPVICVALLSGMTFKLSPDSGEKIGLSLTVLLAYAVYLTLVSTNIPTTSIKVSVLSLYLVLILIFCCVAVIITILVLDCYFKPDDEEVTPTTQKIARFMAKTAYWKSNDTTCFKSKDMTCRKNKKQTNHTVSLQDETAMQDNQRQKTWMEDEGKEHELYKWKEIALITDNFFFVYYFLAVVVLTFVFMIALVAGYFVGS